MSCLWQCRVFGNFADQTPPTLSTKPQWVIVRSIRDVIQDISDTPQIPAGSSMIAVPRRAAVFEKVQTEKREEARALSRKG